MKPHTTLICIVAGWALFMLKSFVGVKLGGIGLIFCLVGTYGAFFGEPIKRSNKGNAPPACAPKPNSNHSFGESSRRS